MGYADDMCDIVVEHAGEKVRYFARVDPQDREPEVLYTREDVEWTAHRDDTVERELHELLASEAYADQMNADEITQIIRVADSSVLFTGLIEDEVVVVHFERGILGVLPAVVSEFRSYMLDHDVDFTALSMPAESA